MSGFGKDFFTRARFSKQENGALRNCCFFKILKDANDQRITGENLKRCTFL